MKGQKKEDSEGLFKKLKKMLNAMKMRKNSYCHQAYPQIVVASLDFVKIVKQTQKAEKVFQIFRYQV